MQEDNSMAEKILKDLENIIYSDDNLKQFDIIPILENDINKSPVLYEEHNIGLEMWCVKHVYAFTHSYLLKIRNCLKKKNLSPSELEKVNRLLLGAVLIQPDVSTFWNMRRDLIEMNLIKADKELLLTRLVLSYKSKSNEAFSHRRWVLKRIFKALPIYDISNTEAIVDKELSVAKMASQKVQNNYHAWTHRIWLIENIINLTFKSVIIKEEFTASLDWIFHNVSEHSGFHYRQRLFLYLKLHVYPTDNYFLDFKLFIINYLHIVHNSTDSLLVYLLGEIPSSKSSELYNCFISVLLFELLYTCYELNKSYPGHESIWCHRRFILYSLFQTIYEFFDINWERDVRINDIHAGKTINFITANMCDLAVNNKLQENGEKYPKLFKAEPRAIENTFLYKFLLKTETDFISNNISNQNSVQIGLVKRHEKWLKCILQVDYCN